MTEVTIDTAREMVKAGGFVFEDINGGVLVIIQGFMFTVVEGQNSNGQQEVSSIAESASNISASPSTQG